MLLKSCRLSALVALLGIAVTVSVNAGVPVGNLNLLDANFNNRIPGDILGEGGAQVGEPSDISALDGVIVQQSPGDNFLRVSNNTGFTDGRSLRWDLLNDAEITTGTVAFKFQFTPSALDRYSLGVRESGGSSRTFLAVTFSSNGTFSATDAAGVISVTNATYAANAELAVVMEFDMDARTSQMTVNGLPVFSGRSHGIVDRGVGRVLTGYNSGHGASPFDLDELTVDAPGPLPLVLDANFDDKTVGQPIGTGGAQVGEPTAITTGLQTEVVENGVGNRGLRLRNAGAGTAQSVRFQFLDNLEVDSGVIAFDFDVRFAIRDFYQFLVRERNTSSSNFASLRFFNDGTLALTDADGGVSLPPISYNAGQLYRLRFIFDTDADTYSVLLDNTELVVDRAHTVSSRDVGAIAIGVLGNATAAAELTIDALQVGAEDAPLLPSELVFLVEPSVGLVGQPLSPALEVGVVNVFDGPVPDGIEVVVGIESGPGGATLNGAMEPVVAGTARFDSLRADTPGNYQLRARAGTSTRSSLENISVLAPNDPIFRNGFD